MIPMATQADVRRIALRMEKNEYGQYLLRLLEEEPA